MQRYLSFTKCLLLIFMMFSLKINALDIPLNDLLVWSQFHCFDVNICTSPLEYCNSYAKECRPCTEDICAKRGGEDFPLQCNLNCSIGTYKITFIPLSFLLFFFTYWSDCYMPCTLHCIYV